MALPSYASSLISAVTRVQQNVPLPQFVIGGRNSGTYKLFKKSTTYDFTVWRSKVFQIGKNFDVLQIKFAVIPVIAANMSIIPVLYFDNENANSIGTTINLTNYPVDAAGNGQKLVILTAKNFSNAVHGKNNFFLELQITSSVLTVVELPITIELEVEGLE